MKGARNTAIVAVMAVVIAAVGVAPRIADATDPKLKEMMGENYAGLQRILLALIQAKYADVPDQVKLIHDHATQLTQMVPDSAKTDRDQFLAYAYNLRAHADDLASISRVLTERDAGRQQLLTDQLREAAAAHYGGMVTMCVSCHNRFRPAAP
jgi:hypothetical protein